MTRQKQRLRTAREEKDKQKDMFVVDARNTKVERNMQKELAAHAPKGQKIPVFCISNYEYNSLVKGPNHKVPRMTAEETGVPRLRSYANSLTAPAVFEARKAYLLSTVPLFIEGLHLWTQERLGECNDELIKVVQNPIEIWPVVSQTAETEVINGFKTGTIHDLRSRYDESHSALMRYWGVLNDKDFWKSQSFLPFFRKHGNHYTPTMGRVSWIEEFSKSQTEDVVNPAWDRMPSTERFFSAATSKITQTIKDIPNCLKWRRGSAALPLEIIWRLGEATVEGITSDLGVTHLVHEQDLKNIKLNATRDQETG